MQGRRTFRVERRYLIHSMIFSKHVFGFTRQAISVKALKGIDGAEIAMCYGTRTVSRGPQDVALLERVTACNLRAQKIAPNVCHGEEC